MAALPLACGDRALDPRGRRLLAICAGWLLTFTAAAAVLDYRPLRYFTIMFPPLGILAGYACARLLRWGRGETVPGRPATVPSDAAPPTDARSGLSG